MVCEALESRGRGPRGGRGPGGGGQVERAQRGGRKGGAQKRRAQGGPLLYHKLGPLTLSPAWAPYCITSLGPLLYHNLGPLIMTMATPIHS